jgi:hypothetical protein
VRYYGQPKTLTFELSAKEQQALTEALKHDKCPEVRQRAMGVRFLHEGKSPKAVSDFFSMSQPTVYDWWRG